MCLECRDITFRYPGTASDVFQNLSFQMAEPGFHALFGPSGVGKTSLAKVLTGEYNATAGDLHAEALETRLYSYNLERLPGWSSVGKHIDKITPAEKSSIRDDLIRAFGVGECMTSRFSQLSLGQQNRVNLIRYLLQDFHLLIMDESLANVDEMTREGILLNVKKMFPEAFFLYISHNVVEVSKFCKEILILRPPGKRPQAMIVRGQDLREGEIVEKRGLEFTMLEIMNAS
jgi:ABC-type nitrate/sulfonate/bicarbonate transport system ATPase subunit